LGDGLSARPRLGLFGERIFRPATMQRLDERVTALERALKAE
jgi:hypothetical protein